MDHLTLEQEIATELNPFSTGVAAGSAPTLRRETVLTILSQTAQLADDFAELLIEAGFLGAAISELKWFVGAEVRGDTLVASAGSVADNANSAPTTHQIASDARRSAFQFAIESGYPIIIANVESETRFRDSYLIERGFMAGVVCPINYRDQQYGAIGFFTPELREFRKDEVMFLQSIALFLGPARAHQKTARSLAEHTRVLSSAIDSLEAMVLLLSADGSVLQMNRACQTASGFKLAELRGRRIWNSFWQPNEYSCAQSVIAELKSGETQVKRQAFFVTKRGAVRRVSWTFAKLHDGNGSGPAVLATGIDVTAQYQSLEKLDEVEREEQPNSGDNSSDQWHSVEDAIAADSEPLERRKHDRRPYQCVQMVAPCFDGSLPALPQFRDVRCFDISPGGFSFLLATRPAFKELVAAFGSPQSRLYLRARIKHISPFQFDQRKVLLVGCEYVGRVRAPIAQF